MMNVPDAITKSIVLRAPIARVWRAVSEARELGAWFGVDFDGPFVPGARTTGRIRPTMADPEVAKLQEPHAGKPFVITVERMEEPRLFSFRWHPYPVAADADPANEPTTLVTFTLEEVSGGTKLLVTESGFDRVPLARRAEAFKANEGGWEHQTRLVEKWLARDAG